MSGLTLHFLRYTYKITLYQSHLFLIGQGLLYTCEPQKFSNVNAIL